MKKFFCLLVKHQPFNGHTDFKNLAVSKNFKVCLTALVNYALKSQIEILIEKRSLSKKCSY